MSTRGCDISAIGQGMVDFDALKADPSAISFVIAKATEGTGFTDPQFSRNWAETKRVGLQRGGYHFARPDLGTLALNEATYFLVTLGPLDATDVLALDYEVDWTGGAVVGWCKQWLDAVLQATRNVPFIYLNRSLVSGHDWSPVIAAGYPLWLADYDGQPETIPQTPWPRVEIKQWTSVGRLAGIAGNVDLNTRFGGAVADQFVTKADFAAYQADVKATIDAMKAAYDPLVPLAHPQTHAHDVPPKTITLLAQTTGGPK